MDSLPRLHPLNVKVGAWLKTKREAAGLSLVEVGQHLNLDPSHIGEMENGDRGAPMPLLEKMRKLYRCSPDEVVEMMLEAQMGGGS